MVSYHDNGLIWYMYIAIYVHNVLGTSKEFWQRRKLSPLPKLPLFTHFYHVSNHGYTSFTWKTKPICCINKMQTNAETKICEAWSHGSTGSAASDLGQHCLPITIWRVSRLLWVKWPVVKTAEVGGIDFSEPANFNLFTGPLRCLS